VLDREIIDAVSLAELLERKVGVDQSQVEGKAVGVAGKQNGGTRRDAPRGDVVTTFRMLRIVTRSPSISAVARRSWSRSQSRALDGRTMRTSTSQATANDTTTASADPIRRAFM
jgi:hypothetical protein